MKEVLSQQFDKALKLDEAEYENCIFNQCDFSNQDLSGYKFIDCKFKVCNLSMCKLNKTTLQDVVFTDCKLLGIKFETCNPFSLSFSCEGCQLNHSSFYQMKIPKMIFSNSALLEVDFTEANLSAAIFNNCNLSGAIFDRTNLEKADFRTAVNFSIHPLNNQIKKARFSRENLMGLLYAFNINLD